jgi:peptidyl-prolyl cis-trans isomerase B (cyclophilin B)
MPESKRRRKRKKGRYPGMGDAYAGHVKPTGPFAFLGNVRLFYVAGVLIMMGGLAAGGVATAVRRGGGSQQDATALLTPEATVEATVAPEPTTTIKQYDAPPPMTIDSEKSYTAVIHTEKGDIRLELFAADAPQTVNNFVFLAREGFYDGVTFHRVDPGFVAQAGDPTGTGLGGPGYAIPDEVNEQGFTAGTLGMALVRDEPGTAGSQFFITYTDQPTFDGRFTAFGRVVEGMDVLGSLTERDPATGTHLPAGDAIVGVDIEES